MTAKEIRQSFKDFFAAKNHKIVPSAPMVIKGDPTLMFTNAGMNQFKDIILGNVPIKDTRVADSQKCLRVSGKHNDLEEVGHDTYHHTMFEMLGNWSFGDYFKKDAIEYAWEYLTEVLKLDKNRLYVTVFEGSPSENLERDQEAAGYWLNYLPSDRIINGNKHDNFWEMGDTGPCGPCSEIHIDLRPEEERAKTPGVSLVNHDHPQVIEIWNLVFMQFNRKADGSLEGLPNKVIDTGMGFERLCMAVQGKTSNYDTDVFQPLIQAISDICHGMADQVHHDKQAWDAKQQIAMRVIADHIRTIAFSITDGQLPSNAKAGYVIRRILRRAVRYGYTFLDRKKPFMYQLIPALIASMGDAYPELAAQKELIEKVIKEEEDSFLRTLETGIKLLDKIIVDARAAHKTTIKGEDAFVLYDTYGFPLDLTELILRENDMEVDKVAFETEMTKQKERARNAAAVETGDWTVVRDGEPEFVGYDEISAVAHILRYRQVKQNKDEYYQIVLDKTPFYAEMGGQTGDSGVLIDDQGNKTEIFDTKRENNLAVHLMHKLPKDVKATFTAILDEEKRHASESNHTATHLLHEALREVLGTHVEQKGSFVSPDVLRFDFSHFQKVTDEELREVEKKVNKKIRENIALDEKRHVPIAVAKAMGAMALFGEKYGDDVRVVKFGESVELCGGTHISATGRIGRFLALSESSVAAGIRRIEAVTAQTAEKLHHEQQDLLHEIKGLFNHPQDVIGAIKKVLDENSELKKQVESSLKDKAQAVKKEVIANKKEINGKLLFTLEGSYPAEMVKDIAFQIKGEYPESTVFVAATEANGKPLLTVMLSENLVKSGLNAGQIVREAAKNIQGGGGGQPHFAQAGGKDVKGLSTALTDILVKLT